MNAAVPLGDVSSNTKPGTVLYFRDLLKAKAAVTSMCVQDGRMKLLVLGRGFSPGTGNQSISSVV